MGFKVPKSQLEIDEWAFHLLLAAIEGRVRILEHGTQFRGLSEPEDGKGVTTHYKIVVEGFVEDHGSG